jgi:hypothetical protein
MAPMSEYQLNKLLFDTAGRHQMVESISDEQELAAYDLSPAEREALRQGDLTRLYELGANPYLIRRVFRPRFKI